jgi:hypothetical protein
MRTSRTVVLVAAVAVASPLAVLASGVATAGAPRPNTVPSTTATGPGTSVSGGDRFAVVRADGTTARGKGVLSSLNVGPGSYEVIFNRNVTRCAFLATIGSAAASGTEPTGEVTTVRRVGTTNGVFLTTTDSTGAAADRGFHLLVACPT